MKYCFIVSVITFVNIIKKLEINMSPVNSKHIQYKVYIRSMHYKYL